MVKVKPFTLVNVVLATALTTSLFFVATGVRIDSNPTVNAAGYDPWLDCNDDGIINMLDIYYPALSYGATGDATKNVNVTNWPTSTDVNVWWMEEVVPGGLMSAGYSSGGFGQLHVLIYGDYLSGAETLTVNIRGRLPNATGSTWRAVTAYTVTLTSTSNTADVSVPVPSGVFYFTVPYDAASSCSVSLSFYLTWT